MFDESARFGRPSAMRWRQRVDRLRYSAPRGQGLDQRAAFKIVADQRFWRKANSQPRQDGGTHGLRTIRAEIAGDLDRRAGAAGPLEHPAVGRIPSCVEDTGVRGQVLRASKRLGEPQIVRARDEQSGVFAKLRSTGSPASSARSPKSGAMCPPRRRTPFSRPVGRKRISSTRSWWSATSPSATTCTARRRYRSTFRRPRSSWPEPRCLAGR